MLSGKPNLDHPPTIAIVGRPNVGKSTLFNRLLGSRRAIVGDEPGITRDRLYGESRWNGRQVRIVDTGGIIPYAKELIASEVFRQARVALEEADAIIMVVDGRSELTATDLELSRLLMRTGKPLLLAVNKIDSPKLETAAENYRTLGIRAVYFLSAEHGAGVAELLEAALERIPPPALEAEESRRSAATEAEARVAIIGRPNVGKSTLLNRLSGAARAIVTPQPGTTRDAVDVLLERGPHRYRFIDTAGIRRKGKTRLMAEKLSVVMARKHLEAADLALLMIDASEGVTTLDATIGGYAHESGRSSIIVVNKWDLAGQQRPAPAPLRSQDASPNRSRFEQQVRDRLKFLHYAPVVFISATTGKNVDQLFSLLETVASERRKRIPTAEINRFLKTVDFDRASPPASRRVKIYYLTQAAVAPPTFVLFTDRDVKLHFSYQRFLENQIRRAFGFLGTPIWIKNRAHE